MLRFCIALLAGAAGLFAQIPATAASAISDGRLLILDSNNVLAVAETKSGTVRKVGLRISPQAVDLSAGGRLDENLIFLATRGSTIETSPVVRVSAQGQQLASWRLPDGYPSGVALDYQNRILYVSSLQTGEIFSIKLNEGGSLAHYVAEMSGASRLGPLAVDPATGRIFAADVFSGRIYMLTLSTRRSSVVVAGLGRPSALALGRGGRTLYIADTDRRCVWAVELGANRLRAVAFLTSSAGLREPLGVTVDTDQTIWVGDHSTQTVSGFDAGGRLVKQLR